MQQRELVVRKRCIPVEEVQVSFSSSNRSFHFPLLDATSGGTSSFNEVMRKHSSENHLEQQSQPAETPGTTQKAAGNSWFPMLLLLLTWLLRESPAKIFSAVIVSSFGESFSHCRTLELLAKVYITI
ncbi:hypothetical protein OIU77_001682 [Salix suchowensis]|uniref:Uncharacterized protein n=1 Tax=Salix suchowensis TaxID=1278906 RepID=A0ABQ9B287_9ROSI|nr:hypothetical protein OIU77_001682 [Salix suchowensis]